MMANKETGSSRNEVSMRRRGGGEGKGGERSGGGRAEGEGESGEGQSDDDL